MLRINYQWGLGFFVILDSLTLYCFLALPVKVPIALVVLLTSADFHGSDVWKLCRILQTSSSCAKANLNSQPSEAFPSLLTLSWWFACCEVFAGVFWPFLHIHCVTAKWATDAKWKRPKSYIAFPWLVALQSWCEGGLGAAGRKRSGMRMCIWKSRGTVNERWS